MKTVIDLVLIAIMVICIWSGYKKGLLMGVGGILVIIVSIYGANLLANVFSYDLEPAARPFIYGYAEGLLNGRDSKVMEKMGWENRSYSTDDLLSQYPDRQEEFCQVCYETVGIDSVAAQSMARRAVVYARESGGTVTGAMKYILSQSICYVAIFIVAFLLICIVLTVIGNLPNLSYKIPMLDLVNDILGTLLGAATGFLFCVLLVWALKFFGMPLGDALSGSGIGGWLLEKDFLLPYLGI